MGVGCVGILGGSLGLLKLGEPKERWGYPRGTYPGFNLSVAASEECATATQTGPVAWPGISQPEATLDEGAHAIIRCL